MKKLQVMFIALIISAVSFAHDPGGIDEKLIRSFQTSFPNAEKVNWYELKSTYVVNFIEGGIRGRIEYRKDGRTTQYTRYYTAAHLPFVVQSSVAKAYPDRSVYGVIEVSTVEAGKDSKLDYYVKMQDQKHWSMVKCDTEGNIRQVEKYRKQ